MNNTNLLPQEIGHIHRHQPQDDEPVLIMSESGMPILQTMSGVTMPADYSFECINNFVHCENPDYEDLQNLALGMSEHIGQLKAQIAAQEPVAWRVHRRAKGRPSMVDYDGPALFQNRKSAESWMHGQMDFGGWVGAWIEDLYAASKVPQ